MAIEADARAVRPYRSSGFSHGSLLPTTLSPPHGITHYYLLLTNYYSLLSPPYPFAVPRKTSIFANWIRIII